VQKFIGDPAVENEDGDTMPIQPCSVASSGVEVGRLARSFNWWGHWTGVEVERHWFVG